MKNFIFLGSIFVFSLGLASPTVAQTAVTTPLETAKEVTLQEVVKIAVSARATSAMQLPEDEPASLNLQLWNFPSAPTDINTNVTLKGFARTVMVEERKIAQVVVTSVSKEDKTVVIDTAGFVAQFDTEKGILTAGQEFTVEGNRDSLIEALRKLEEEPPVVEITPQQEIQTDDETSSSDVGGNSKSNDQASSYQSPARVAPDQEAEISVLTTTSGCSVRIDDVQKVAIQQSKTQTTEGGAMTESECSDSEVRYPLEKSFTNCSDAIDLVAMTATPQYSLYYTDQGGATQAVSTCAPDTDQVFTISEKTEGCIVFTDFDAGEAVTQAALVYININNVEQQVRGCQPSSEISAIPMLETSTNCPLRHEFSENQSYQMNMFTYSMGGLVYQATQCADTGLMYPHEVVTTMSTGDYICSTLVNMTDRTVTLQSRIQITIDGAKQYISECVPETSSTLAIVSTTETCEDPSRWAHDIAAGVSYGQERFYFINNGIRDYVTECQTSADTWPHNHVTTGYQYNDDELYSYPLVTVTISPQSGLYNVRTSQVLAGTAQIPYEYVDNATLQTGISTYEGCDAYRETALYEVYTRPDLSTYQKPIGQGTPVGPSNNCEIQVSTSWTYYSTSTSRSGIVPYGTCAVYDTENYGWGGSKFYRTTTYQGVKTLVRTDDGFVVSTETGTGSTSSMSCGGYPGLDTNPVTNTSTISGWRTNLGWW